MGPQVHFSHALFTADRVLKRNQSVPMRDEDQPASGGFGSGDGTCAFTFADHAIWTFDEEVLSGELHIADFLERFADEFRLTER